MVARGKSTGCDDWSDYRRGSHTQTRAARVIGAGARVARRKK